MVESPCKDIDPSAGLLDFDTGPLEQASDTAVALVVDDESMNVFCMRGMLKNLGISSDSTMVSTRAVKLVEDRIAKVKEGKAEMYKILLIDYSMPEFDGLELVQRLRSMLQESQLNLGELPIYCCCTAYDTAEHCEIAIKSGFNYFMVKPMNQNELEEIVIKH